jgi:hypothetical protein
MNEKTKSQHLQRKAILYIHQSSTYQVHNNLESQKLHFAPIGLERNRSRR